MKIIVVTMQLHLSCPQLTKNTYHGEKHHIKKNQKNSDIVKPLFIFKDVITQF